MFRKPARARSRHSFLRATDIPRDTWASRARASSRCEEFHSLISASKVRHGISPIVLPNSIGSMGHPRSWSLKEAAGPFGFAQDALFNFGRIGTFAQDDKFNYVGRPMSRTGKSAAPLIDHLGRQVVATDAPSARPETNAGPSTALACGSLRSG